MALTTVFWRPVNLLRSKETRASSEHTSTWGLLRIYRNTLDPIKGMAADNIGRRITAVQTTLESASLRALADLSYSENEAVRELVTKKLEEIIAGNKIGSSKMLGIVKGFNREVLLGAAIKTVEVSANFYKPFFEGCVLSENELAKLVEANDDGIRRMAALRTADLDLKIEVVDKCYPKIKWPVTIREIFNQIIKIVKESNRQLSSAQIDKLNKIYGLNREEQLLLYLQDQASPQTCAKIISSITPKSRRVITSPEECHYEDIEEGNMDYRPGFHTPEIVTREKRIDKEAEYEYLYSSDDIKSAVDLLKFKPEGIRQEILSQLNTINPELADLIRENI